jgi:protein-disulfide isomerase
MIRREFVESMVLSMSFACVVGTVVVFSRDRHDAPPPPEKRTIQAPAEFATRGFVRGPATASHTLIVFSDFQCPYCRQFAAVADSIVAKYPQVRVVERHLPLSDLHASAWDAALAAECAGVTSQYGAMRHALFSHPREVEEKNWGVLAADAGIADTTRLVACVQHATLAANVMQDTAAAAHLGANGTPTVLLDKTLFGQPPTLREIVEELKRTK